MSYYSTAALRGCGDYTSAAMQGCGFYNSAAISGAGRLKKGSREAKEYMAYLRSLRGRAGKGRRGRNRNLRGAGPFADVIKKLIGFVTKKKTDGDTQVTLKPGEMPSNLPIDPKYIPDPIKDKITQITGAQNIDEVLAGPIGQLISKSIDFWKNKFAKNREIRQSQQDMINQLAGENEELSRMSPEELQKVRRANAYINAVMDEYKKMKQQPATPAPPKKNQLLIEYQPSSSTEPTVSTNPSSTVITPRRNPRLPIRRRTLAGRGCRGGAMSGEDWKNVFLGPYGWYQLYKTKKNQKEIDRLQKLREQYLRYME